MPGAAEKMKHEPFGIRCQNLAHKSLLIDVPYILARTLAVGINRTVCCASAVWRPPAIMVNPTTGSSWESGVNPAGIMFD